MEKTFLYLTVFYYSMNVRKLFCFQCGKEYPPETEVFYCDECGYTLDVTYDLKEIDELIPDKEAFKKEHLGQWKYKAFYPVNDVENNKVSLQEGATPLIPSRKNNGLYYKFEGVNPTCCFKDRGTSVEVSKAKEMHAEKLLVASTGNMGASIAAYGALAGIKTKVYVPSFASKVKIKQIQAYGAEIKIFDGGYDSVLNRTKEKRERTGDYLTGDYHYRSEGQKSVGYEICDQLNWEPPEYIISPIGNGALIYAVYKGCKELIETGFTDKMPKIIGVQSTGCNPVVKAFEEDSNKIEPQYDANTIASAINCDNPVFGLQALHAVKESGGFAKDVRDSEMLIAKRDLAKRGLYCESSGAATLALYRNMKEEFEGKKTVLILTGHGLKEEF